MLEALPCSLHVYGSVIEQAAKKRLFHGHGLDLIHVNLDGVPAYERTLVNDAPVCHGKFRRPIPEPRASERDERKDPEKQAGHEKARGKVRRQKPGRVLLQEGDADRSQDKRAQVHDPGQAPHPKDMFVRLKYLAYVAHDWSTV